MITLKGMSMNMKLILLAAALTLPASAALADGDAKKGAVVFKKCMACHTATAPKNMVGPSLMGIVGRPVAKAEGFKYSPAMIAFGEGKVWDEATLASYLPAPSTLVKGTKMAFAGLKKHDEIEDLIAYLKDPAAAK